jgi:hypothetical protein
MTPQELKDEIRGIERVLLTPEGTKFVQALERRFVLGDPPDGDRELWKWLGARELVLFLRARLNEGERTGTTNG